jgi:hypothetical protein
MGQHTALPLSDIEMPDEGSEGEPIDFEGDCTNTTTGGEETVGLYLGGITS